MASFKVSGLTLKLARWPVAMAATELDYFRIANLVNCCSNKQKVEIQLKIGEQTSIDNRHINATKLKKKEKLY